MLKLHYHPLSTFSRRVRIALIEKGMSREQAYKVAQRNAAKAWEGVDFRQSVAKDEDVRKLLSDDEVKDLFSLNHHLRNVGYTLRAIGI